MRIEIGSRGSALALWQANWLREQLATAGHDPVVRVIHTSGDRQPQAALAGSGIKGLFIKELEEALIAGSIDVGVHSLKDLPIDLPTGLKLAAVPAREDARDALISRGHAGFAALPLRSRVGTSSLRRQSQLLHLRPDLTIIPARGNIDTRLRKLDAGEYDALVLAAAGLRRLGLSCRISEYFKVEQLCPAAGQGALGLETREDSSISAPLAALDDATTHTAVRAERALLRELGGGCAVPIAGFASASGDSLDLCGVVADPTGARLVRSRLSGAAGADGPEHLGAQVAQELLRQGAREILGAH
jgi:hydroxymethylbilane synthase